MRRRLSLVVAGVLAASAIILAACGPTITTYTVSGNTILEPGGAHAFEPFGYVMPCLGYTFLMDSTASQICVGNDQNSSTSGVINNQTGTSMIDYAAAEKANVIRLQVAPSNYFFGAATPWTTSSTPNSAFVSKMDTLAYLAGLAHMAVIITDQEENDSKSPGPQMGRDDIFWNSIATHYSQSPSVMFDLYNEPYGTASAGFDCTVPAQRATAWTDWQSGGGGFLSMQSLASTVRGVANNLIIAEGPCHDQDLSGIPGHTLTGGNIAYGFEPNLTSNGTGDGSGNDRTMAQWEARFGKYHDGTVASLPLMPEAFVGYYSGGHCDPTGANGYIDPNPNGNSNGDFLDLAIQLHNWGLGMIFFSTNPGTGPQYSSTQFSSAPGTPTSTNGWGVSPWVSTECPNGAGDPTHTPFGFGDLFAYVSGLWSRAQ